MQYRVLTPIKTLAGMLNSGDLADFTTDEAEELLKLKAIEAVDQPFSKTGAGTNG